MKTNKYQLILNDFQVPVKLGVSETERSVPQNIAIDIIINFKQLPLGCISDNIQDTICYDRLCNNIVTFCQHKEFNLLEHLCYQLYDYLTMEIKNSGTIQLSISKISPVNNLKSSQFCIGHDFY